MITSSIKISGQIRRLITFSRVLNTEYNLNKIRLTEKTLIQYYSEYKTADYYSSYNLTNYELYNRGNEPIKAINSLINILKSEIKFKDNDLTKLSKLVLIPINKLELNKHYDVAAQYMLEWIMNLEFYKYNYQIISPDINITEWYNKLAELYIKHGDNLNTTNQSKIMIKDYYVKAEGVYRAISETNKAEKCLEFVENKL